MAKQKQFVVTKFRYQDGLELKNQYLITARSEKEAMEITLHQEKILIQEVEEPKSPIDPTEKASAGEEAKPQKK